MCEIPGSGAQVYDEMRHVELAGDTEWSLNTVSDETNPWSISSTICDDKDIHKESSWSISSTICDDKDIRKESSWSISSTIHDDKDIHKESSWSISSTIHDDKDIHKESSWSISSTICNDTFKIAKKKKVVRVKKND